MTFEHTDIVSLSDGLAERKPPVWLIHGILEANTFSALVAKAGSYKSFIALDMAQSIAHGIDWHGFKTQKGSVVYCVGEGLQGVYGRTLGWHNHHGLNHEDADLYLLKGAKGLQDQQTAKALYDSIKHHTKNKHIKLLIIDTLSRYSTGIDENSNSDMAKLVETVTNELSVPLDCSVMLVHHTGKIGTSARGASALNGALDAEWSLTSNGLTLIMANTKSKDHAAPKPLLFDMLTVPIELGKEETTLLPKLSEDLEALTALTVDQELRGEGSRKANKAQLLYAHLADTYEETGQIANLTSNELSEAIDTASLPREWKNMMRMINKHTTAGLNADSLSELLPQVEALFKSSNKQ
jgi:hypothetical protein|tara:strand:+ start:2489 stop:3547 length:1059 start_codon:yes stop_codon:yes gene_type:complete